MRTLFITLAVSLCVALPVTAQHILINGEKISIPVPAKYEDSGRESDSRTFLYFKTKKIEPLEKAGEFDEGINVYGAGIRPRKDRSNQQVFEQIFATVYTRMKNRVSGNNAPVNTGDMNADLIKKIFNSAGGNTAATLDLTANDSTQKSFVVLAGYELIGVVTIPIYVETSFVFVKDRIVFAHNYRVAVAGNSRKPSKAIKSEMRRTSKKLRTAIQKENR